MQPTGEVEANPLCFSAGPAKDGSAMVLHPLSRLVKEGVLGIVCHAVGYYEVKVCFKLLQAPVEVSIDSFSHGGEVNRVLDDIQVVRYLQRTDIRCSSLRGGRNSGSRYPFFKRHAGRY